MIGTAIFVNPEDPSQCFKLEGEFVQAGLLDASGNFQFPDDQTELLGCFTVQPEINIWAMSSSRGKAAIVGSVANLAFVCIASVFHFYFM